MDPRAPRRPRLAPGIGCVRLLLVLVLTVPLVQCINGSPESPAATVPTSPSTPTAPAAPTLSSVAVTGISGPANPGQTAQLTATATYSDGSSETVTNQATWESGNTVVVTVSPSGVVTFVALGEADVRATFRSVTGSAHITVTAAPVRRFNLTGVLTDADNRRGVANARVEVTDGADAGRATTTAGDGGFTLADLAEGTFSVRITHPSYETTQRPVVLTGAARLDLELRPLVNVASLYGTFPVSLHVATQNCEFPITPAPTGQLTLAGNADGTGLRVTLVERGTTRTYNGGMRADGSFDGTGGGFIAGIIYWHDYTGGIQGRVVGSRVSGTESVNYAAPCPGRRMVIEFTGSK